jgi:dephospho-CoA kinase
MIVCCQKSIGYGETISVIVEDLLGFKKRVFRGNAADRRITADRFEREFPVSGNAAIPGIKVPRIPVIGIVGGIGSGKSAVAKWVAGQANVDVIDADILGHDALRDAAVKDALCRRFGTEILVETGEINRSALARQVFGPDPSHREARRALEQIVHPEIGRRISQRINQAAADGHTAVLLDAAVMLEAGWNSKCDLVVFVDCPERLRLERVHAHRGWSEDELRRREASQLSLADKRREADLIVVNDNQIEQAGRQLLDSLQQQGLLK